MVDIGKLAVETGSWPLKEFVDGRIRHTHIPSRRVPLEDYLCLQGRFRHLFKPVRDDERLSGLQHRVDDYWANLT
jgi:pyruvate ferredoxin oxidoreductase beta subunit